jgi:hypothetical protein
VHLHATGVTWRQAGLPNVASCSLSVDCVLSTVTLVKHNSALLKCKKVSKAVPLHAMEALGGRGGIAPTHSRPRH